MEYLPSGVKNSRRFYTQQKENQTSILFIFYKCAHDWMGGRVHARNYKQCLTLVISFCSQISIHSFKYSNQLHICITNNINKLCLSSNEKGNLERCKCVICVSVNVCVRVKEREQERDINGLYGSLGKKQCLAIACLCMTTK